MLGPLQVVVEDSEVVLGALRERQLLAALLVRANETVSTAQLVNDLWGEDPPRTAARTVQAYVSRLRRALPGAALVTAGAGYRLDVDPDDIDATRFANLGFEGRRALDRDDAAGAARVLDDALALWRGEPLAEFDEMPFASVEATRLRELRLTIVEDRVAAGLALGEGPRLVAELQRLVRAHPLRERFWGQLMVALYQSGRQADALATYQMARRVLVDDAGVEPGDELRAVERAVLDHDPSLLAPTPEPAASHARTVTVTVLMTDIEGSTRAWEVEEAAMATAVEMHERTVASAVRRHGGELLKTRGEGDSTFSVFQRASAATAAALDLQRDMGTRAWPTPSPIRVRAAVHTGEIQARDGDYYGQAINRTARLRSLAAGGEIFVSATTAGLVADVLAPDVELLDLGLQPLRDLSRPEHVYALWHPSLGARPRPVRTEAPLPGALRALTATPLIGRERELERLDAAIQKTAAGQPAVLLVVGEPGIGKSRLVAEAARSAADRGALVVYGRCDEQPLSSFQPFVEILGRLAPHLRASAIAEVLEDAPELAVLVPELARVAAGLVSDRPTLPSDRLRMFDGVARLLGQPDCPVVVVIDDLHWADEPTVQLLRHVTRSAVAGCAVLATLRHTELGRTQPLTSVLADIARDAITERLDIAGLGLAAVAALIPRAELVEDVWRATAGNAFFVVEVARHLADGGGEDVPESVKQVVGQRVSRLGDVPDRLLAAAAVVGQEFDLGLAATVAGLDEDEALDAADEALRAGLLRSVEADRLSFAHALVRQTMVDELTPSRRIRMHRRVAEAIEHAYAGGLDEWAPALAFHWAAAGDQTPGGPAFRYAMQAGDRAASLLGWEDCVDHYSRALEHAEAAGDVAGQAAALTELGETHLLTGDVAQADALIMRAIELARTSSDPDLFARAALSYGTVARSIEGIDPIIELLEEGLERLGPAETARRAQLLGRLAFSRLFLGSGGPEMARQAYEMATRVGDPLAIVTAANALRFVGPGAIDLDAVEAAAKELLGTKWVMWPIFVRSWRACADFQRGDVAAAVAGWDDLVERTQDSIPLVVGQRALFEALLAGLRGEFDAADTRIADAAERLRFGEANTMLLIGSVAAAIGRMRGRYADGTDALEALRLRRPDLASPRLALAYAATGRPDDARNEIASLAEDGFARMTEEWAGIYSLGLLARALSRAPDERYARQVYEQLLPWSGELLTLHGFLDCLGAVDFHLGLLADVLGHTSDAVTYLEKALEQVERLGFPTLVAEAQAALARAVIDVDPERARQLARTAFDNADRIGMTDVAARVRTMVRVLERPPLPPALASGGRLIGRDEEVDRLRQWHESGPTLALVTGEPGIGKTRLMAELARDVYAGGDPVFYGTCDENLVIPFQPWVMATRTVPGIPPPEARSPDPELERYRWFDEVERGLTDLGRVLVVLDDLHWADAAALALLRHLLKAPLPPGVRLLGSYRDTDLDRTRPLGRFLADLWNETDVLRIDLHGLDRASVAALVGHDQDTARIHDESEGNPLFVTLLATQSANRDERRLPQGIREVVGRRLDRLSPEASALLRVAGLVGREFSLDVVVAAAESAEETVLGAVEDAIGAGLVTELPGVVDRFAFVHGLVGRTLADELSTSRRVRLHRRIGEFLEAGRGHAPAVIAHHFCEAAVAGVAERAVRWARAAGQDALNLGAWDEATQWFDAALDVLDAEAEPQGNIRATVEVELGEALALSGRAVEARVHLESAAALAHKVGDSEVLARAALAFVGQNVKTSFAEAREDELLDEALTAVGEEDSVWRARLLGASAYWNAYIGDRTTVVRRAEEARGVARRIGDDDAWAFACGVLGSLSVNDSEALEAVASETLEASVRAGNAVITSQAYGLLAAASVRRGRLDEARQRADEARAIGLASKVPRARWAGELFASAMFATLEGNWDEAEAGAEAALRTVQGSSANPFLPLGVYLSQLLPIRWMQGRLGELADTLVWAAESSAGPLLWHSAAAMALAEDGRLADAARYLEPVRGMSAENFNASIESGAMVFHLASVLRTLDEPDLAAATYEAIAPQRDVACLFMVYLFLGVYEHHRGSLALAAGWPDVAVGHFEVAIEQYDAMGAHPWADRARADLESCR